MAIVSVQEFQKALDSLQEALDNIRHTQGSQFKLIRDACIQRFEFCVELAWKTSAKVIGSGSRAPNTVIREMARDGLIKDPQIWFDFIEARNKSSHTYNEEIAKEVYQVVVRFLPEAKTLLSALLNK